MKNVAIFGAGRIGRIHATNLVALPGVRLKYVSDPVATAAADLAMQLGATVATVEQVFADAEIDAVVIASSTNTHSDLLSRAAAAGKHIFCEKPFAITVDDAFPSKEPRHSASLTPTKTGACAASARSRSICRSSGCARAPARCRLQVSHA